MYQFSRAIYRELAPHILEDEGSTQDRPSNRLRVLRYCEQAIERLMKDRRYFANPARTLFEDIRTHFSMAEQARVYIVIQRNLELADRYFAGLPDSVLEAHGAQRRCQAMTRKSTECARQPLPGSDYCPSHQHLDETFEEFEAPLAA
jgi:hypothetical protein